jgi:hypothetical protein
MLHLLRNSEYLGSPGLVRALSSSHPCSDALRSSHIFCLNCIKTWRATNGTEDDRYAGQYACPQCRLVTRLVIPSPKFVKYGPEKDAIVQAYKDSKRSIPCRNFQQSLRSRSLFCPFGKDCLYAHKDPITGEDYVFEHTHQDTLDRQALNRSRRGNRAERDAARLRGFLSESWHRLAYPGDYDSYDEDSEEGGWTTEEEEDGGPYQVSQAVEAQLLNLYRQMVIGSRQAWPGENSDDDLPPLERVSSDGDMHPNSGGYSTEEDMPNLEPVSNNRTFDEDMPDLEPVDSDHDSLCVCYAR